MPKQQTQPKRTWPIFPAGSQVATRSKLIGWGMEWQHHIGTVVSVRYAENGYPITIVNFPTYMGCREWAVEALTTPDRYDVAPSYWAV